MPKVTTPPTPLAKAIKNNRMRLACTQMELAVKLSCSKQTISNFENGVSEPAATQLHKLATVFGISLAMLVGENVAEQMEYDHLRSVQVKRPYFEIIAHNEDGKLRMLTSALLGLSDDEWERLWRGLDSVLDEQRRAAVLQSLGLE